MTEIHTRLIYCFQLAFPDLAAHDIPSATQSNVELWDSVATITLLNVIEEQFGVPVDLDLVHELDSFVQIESYLATAAKR